MPSRTASDLEEKPRHKLGLFYLCDRFCEAKKSRISSRFANTLFAAATDSLSTAALKARTVMSADIPALTPTKLSSMTIQSPGATPKCFAADKKRPGSGFHELTSYALNILPTKCGYKFVVCKFSSIFFLGPLDATQKGDSQRLDKSQCSVDRSKLRLKDR